MIRLYANAGWTASSQKGVDTKVKKSWPEAIMQLPLREMPVGNLFQMEEKSTIDLMDLLPIKCSDNSVKCENQDRLWPCAENLMKVVGIVKFDLVLFWKMDLMGFKL